VRADPDQFEQTVLNLAVNARDAMPEGGRLSLSIAPRSVTSSPGPLGVVPGDYVELTVSDTGSGMDAATAERCFEPLFTTKGPGKGTGLGLPAARRVVTDAGGAIGVRSAPGAGTTFQILLPACDEAPAAPPPVEPAVGPQETGTVLLVEDEAGIRAMVARVLAHDGFDVLEADSAEAALELAAAHEEGIDLLVSDVVMGAMSGGELAERLQAERPGLQVVLVSGNVPSSVLDALAPGSAAYLAKPFRPSQLIEVVRELRASRPE
jgi:CheY-like chemotaxis protein